MRLATLGYSGPACKANDCDAGVRRADSDGSSACLFLAASLAGGNLLVPHDPSRFSRELWTNRTRYSLYFLKEALNARLSPPFN